MLLRHPTSKEMYLQVQRRCHYSNSAYSRGRNGMQNRWAPIRLPNQRSKELYRTLKDNLGMVWSPRTDEDKKDTSHATNEGHKMSRSSSSSQHKFVFKCQNFVHASEISDVCCLFNYKHFLSLQRTTSWLEKIKITGTNKRVEKLAQKNGEDIQLDM